MNPIYKPRGRALEYSPDALALNIYTGCPHRCYYCFAPSVLRKDRETFHTNVEPRPGIVEAVKRQLDNGYVEHTVMVVNPEDPCGYLYPDKKGMMPEKRRIELIGKLINLCFTCDPYPNGYDSTATREIIKLIKDSGNHVQILTKACVNRTYRDFDLLDSNDWFGVTYTGSQHYMDKGRTYAEPEAATNCSRMRSLEVAHERGIKTWVSCEPVLSAQNIYDLIKSLFAYHIDLFRIGKLNYHPSDIDWGTFGRECERLCIEHGRNYYIKGDLRKEMEKKDEVLQLQ